MVSPFEKNSAAHVSLPHVTTYSYMTSRKDRGRAMPASKGGWLNFYSINHWMRESQKPQYPVESENEKSFHTGTKHSILHCLNKGHSGEKKKSSLPLGKRKKQVTVFKPPKQPPPRLENLTAPVQMGLSGILSLHIHTKSIRKTPQGLEWGWHLVFSPQGLHYLEKPSEK